MALPMPVEAVEDLSSEQAQEPHAWRWTVDTFFKAGELGFFEQEKHIELIEGEIFINMSSIGSPHAAAIDMLDDALSASFGRKFTVRTQNPLLMPDDSAPEPDLCVVPFRKDRYALAHPVASDALLVIEASDSTYAFDRGRKSRLYASAGIPEYWIVNLNKARLEVHRSPNPEIGYRVVEILMRGDTVTPISAAARRIAVADLIPSLLQS